MNVSTPGTATQGIGPKLHKAFEGVEDRLPVTLAENHPHLLGKVEALWPAPEAAAYLDELLFSDRADRQGFSEAALAEIFFIRQLFDYLHPSDVQTPWERIGEAIVQRARPQNVGDLARAYPVPDRAQSSAPAPPTPPKKRVTLTEEPHPACAWPQLTTLDALRELDRIRRKSGGVFRNKRTRRIGEWLMDQQLLVKDDLDRALATQAAGGEKRILIGRILVSLGLTRQEDIDNALCMQQGVPLIDLDAVAPSSDALARLPADMARQHRAVPVAVFGKTFYLAVEDPMSFAGRAYLAFYTNMTIELLKASRVVLSRRLEYYEAKRSDAQTNADFQSLAKRALGSLPAIEINAAEDASPAIDQDDATVVSLVNKMVEDALGRNASDIHIEGSPARQGTRIRFRRDGVMEDYAEVPSIYHEAIVARIKIMSDLDISERRRPQDGKIDFARFARHRLELRVSTIPTVRSVENVTLRLLASGDPFPLDQIGMATRDLNALRDAAAHPYGLLLVCGPTGSGKTTTLHSLMAELNTPERKIWTAEDPVEITQAGLNQVQVNPKIGLSFAQALRAFLRADPDIVMIGEMRDKETAHIGVEASMTGHLVLSTLHTNSAAETMVRLLDLDIDPFNLSDALVGVLAQRLTRRLCPDCREDYYPGSEEMTELAEEFHFAGHHKRPTRGEREGLLRDWRNAYGQQGQFVLSRPKGCDKCRQTGYRGRVGLYEMLVADVDIKALLRSGAPAAELLATGLKAGMHTLRQDGILKVLQNVTDLHEVRTACV